MNPTSGYHTAFVVLLQMMFPFKTCLSSKAGLGSFPVVISRDFRFRYFSFKTYSTNRGLEVKSLKVYDDFECAIHCSQAGDSCKSSKYYENKKDNNGFHLCELVLVEKSTELLPQGDRFSYDYLSQEAPIHRTCADIYKDEGLTTAVYKIIPFAPKKRSLCVYCDMQTSHGGWTVIQRRLDGTVDFNRNWNEYKQGFGDKLGEYWIGLDNIHIMTSQEENTLRIDMEDFKGIKTYAEYKDFKVLDETNNYRLSVGQYTGNARDSLIYHNGCDFSTKDRDNDKSSGSNCAKKFGGPWWFKGCHESNLNGQYYKSPPIGLRQGEGVVWRNQRLNNNFEPLKRVEIKIRPNNYH